MSGARSFVAELILRSPFRFETLRKIPALGKLVHHLSSQLLPAGENVWVRVRQGPAQGLWLELNPRTGHDFLQGAVEPAVQRILADHLRPGMVFYDLGANIGFFTLLAARLVGKSGKVFSFEPDREVSRRLKRNVEKNGLLNVAVVESGVWSSSGETHFIPADDSSPDRGLGRFAPGESGSRGIATPCIALDEFIEGAPPPNGIKCDIEGAEVEAFRGARRILAGHKPWIVCEIHSAEKGQAVRNLLSRAGYRVAQADSHHLLALPGSEET